MKDRLTWIVGAVIYTLLTSGIFATRHELAATADTLRAEQAQGFVAKPDYREDVREMKERLIRMENKLDELRNRQ